MMIILLQLLFRYTERPFDERYVKELSKLLFVFILVVFYFLFTENAFRAYVPGLREMQMYFLFGGSHSIVFWLGLIGMGIIIPFIILFNSRTKDSIKMINVAAALHVVGVLCERYIIVIPGQTLPADILPNMTVESAGLYAEELTYSISFLEAVQALGIAAIVAIAFILGLKFFAMLPTQALMEDAVESQDAIAISGDGETPAGVSAEEPTAEAPA
jgi:Ni/Fe-hydrogenase subunit HybB-like protein